VLKIFRLFKGPNKNTLWQELLASGRRNSAVLMGAHERQKTELQ
jgi:hypothetical protein